MACRNCKVAASSGFWKSVQLSKKSDLESEVKIYLNLQAKGGCGRFVPQYYDSYKSEHNMRIILEDCGEPILVLPGDPHLCEGEGGAS